MQRDAGGLEILDTAECLKLLSAAPIGRIVFTDQALPAIQPVNYIMTNGAIVIRTATGSKLAAAARSTVVAFEIDDFDADLQTGWSVVAVGRAQHVTSEDELASLRSLPLRPWVPCRMNEFIRITPTIISGRRIPPDHQ